MQNYSFCMDEQAQQQSLAETAQSMCSSQQLKFTWVTKVVRLTTSQVSAQPVDSWGPLSLVLVCQIRSKEDMCPTKVKPFLAKLIFIISHVSQNWDDMTFWEASPSHLPFLLQLIQSRTRGIHNQTMKASRITWKQFTIMPKTCTF